MNMLENLIKQNCLLECFIQDNIKFADHIIKNINYFFNKFHKYSNILRE